jgi:hypothetical protein
MTFCQSERIDGSFDSDSSSLSVPGTPGITVVPRVKIDGAVELGVGGVDPSFLADGAMELGAVVVPPLKRALDHL